MRMKGRNGTSRTIYIVGFNERFDKMWRDQMLNGGVHTITVSLSPDTKKVWVAGKMAIEKGITRGE